MGMLPGMEAERRARAPSCGWEWDDNPRAMGNNARALSQGGKMLRYVSYKKQYSLRVQKRRRADVRETS